MTLSIIAIPTFVAFRAVPLLFFWFYKSIFFFSFYLADVIVYLVLLLNHKVGKLEFYLGI